MSIARQFTMDVLLLLGVCLALAVPLDARADDLSAADLEAVDRALAAPTPATCAEPREHLRSLRDAYRRQEAPVVRSAISARVPALLDTLRFCMETAGSAPTVADAIEPARRSLAAAQARPECSAHAEGIPELVSAWESETSPVVRGALESRLAALTQAVGFCLETLGPVLPIEATAASETELAPIAPLPEGAHAATGGRALGSPFLPAR